MPYFKINGTDIARHIPDDGYNWSDTDFDSDSAGRTLAGEMFRGKVCSKAKVELSCLPMVDADWKAIIKLLDREFVTVQTDLEPKRGKCTLTMYNSSRKSSIRAIYDDGTILWDKISFNLIER